MFDTWGGMLVACGFPRILAALLAHGAGRAAPRATMARRFRASFSPRAAASGWRAWRKAAPMRWDSTGRSTSAARARARSGRTSRCRAISIRRAVGGRRSRAHEAGEGAGELRCRRRPCIQPRSRSVRSTLPRKTSLHSVDAVHEVSRAIPRNLADADVESLSDDQASGTDDFRPRRARRPLCHTCSTTGSTARHPT